MKKNSLYYYYKIKEKNRFFVSPELLKKKDKLVELKTMRKG